MTAQTASDHAESVGDLFGSKPKSLWSKLARLGMAWGGKHRRKRGYLDDGAALKFSESHGARNGDVLAGVGAGLMKSRPDDTLD